MTLLSLFRVEFYPFLSIVMVLRTRKRQSTIRGPDPTKRRRGTSSVIFKVNSPFFANSNLYQVALSYPHISVVKLPRKNMYAVLEHIIFVT